jgi:hypothetical protein
MLHKVALWEHQALTHETSVVATPTWINGDCVSEVVVSAGCIKWYAVTSISRLVSMYICDITLGSR